MHRLLKLLAALIFTAAARAQEAWPAVFDPFRVETIHLQLDPQKWQAILHDTNFYDKSLNLREPCQLWMSGDLAPNSLETSITVEIRRKSDPALPSENDPQKVSLKLDINEFVAGQNLRGLKKLSLENGSGSGLLKEGFAMNLHRLAAESGHHAWNFGNAAWVRLVVNGEYVGLYTSPEQRDSTFLKNRGRFQQHASWLYEINGGISRDDSVNTTDSPTHAALDYYPFRGPNPPPANFEEHASTRVDMRSMLTMAAIEAFIANNDGLFSKSASNQGKNSFCVDWLPPQAAKRTYLPWDLDGGFNDTSWNIFTGGSGQQSQRRYQTLILQHPWFGEMYRQIFTELIEGPLSAASLNAWLDQWQATVGPALAEDPNASADQVNQLRNFLSARIPNVQAQIGSIIRPPVFSPAGGEIAAGFSFSLGHPNESGSNTIHYTTDGSDPRAFGGAVTATAITATGAITLATNTHVKARVRNIDGTTVRWSNLQEATFNVANRLDRLKLTEIHFKPTTAPPFEDGGDFEFIEFKNLGVESLDLGHCRLEGIEFEFPAGTVIAPGGFVVLVANPAAFEARYPQVPYLGTFWKKLSNSGERLRLVDRSGSVVISCSYSDKPPWPLGSLTGRSLVNDFTAGDPSEPSNWRASTNNHGSPGADDPAPPYGPGVVIHEVIANTSAPFEDAIELHNPTAQAIDISGWWLSDDFVPATGLTATGLQKFRIPAGTILPPGAHLAFYEHEFRPASPNADSLSPFGLSRDGETIYLASADAAGELTGHVIGQKFGASGPNAAHGRILTSQGPKFTALVTPTFGDPNSTPLVGPVVITEIHYQPGAGGVEFVELMNLTENPVVLDGWGIKGAAFTFPAGTTLSGGGFLVVADTPDAAGFKAGNNIPGAVQVFGGSFNLDDAGESLELVQPNSDPLRPPLVIDRVRYDNQAPWPTEAAGNGVSLERLTPAAFGDDPLNWHTPTPGGSPGILSSATSSIAITRGSGWKFHADGRDLGAAWRGLGYSDNGWSDGIAPLGFGTAAATLFPYPADPKPITTWLRKSFAIPDPAAIETLSASIDFNDGFIAYLNGTEIARRSLPAGSDALTPAAPHPHGSYEPLDLTPFRSQLRPGRNILAVELHTAGENDADAYFDADLTYTRDNAVEPADTDGDGIPDAWELANQLDPSDPADALVDHDGDGVSAFGEYLAGTDPNDPASRPHISSITPTDPGCRIGFPTVAGRFYQVEWSADLSVWHALNEWVAGTGENTFVEDAAGVDLRFYRLRVRP